MKVTATLGETITLKPGVYEVTNIDMKNKNTVYDSKPTVSYNKSEPQAIPDSVLTNTHTLCEHLNKTFDASFKCDEFRVYSTKGLLRVQNEIDNPLLYSSNGSIHMGKRLPYTLSLGETILLNDSRTLIHIPALADYKCDITYPGGINKTGTLSLSFQQGCIEELNLYDTDSYDPEYSYNELSLFDNGLAYKHVIITTIETTINKVSILIINNKVYEVSLDNALTVEEIVDRINNSIIDSGVKCYIEDTNAIVFRRHNNTNFDFEIGGYLSIIQKNFVNNVQSKKIEIIPNFANPDLLVFANGTNVKNNIIFTGNHLTFKFKLNDVDYVPSRCTLQCYETAPVGGRCLLF